MKKYIIGLIAALFLPAIALAATAVPWQISSLTNPVITPGLINGANKSVIATSTGLIYGNGNRIDSYTADGTIFYPYKTLSSLIAGITSSNIAGAGIVLAPGTYVDGAPDTFPNIPFTLNGNQATYVPVSGVTAPNSFDIYDLTISGPFTMTDNNLQTIHQMNNGVMTGGTTTISAIATYSDMVTTSSATTTIDAGAQFDASGSFMQAPIIDYGLLNFDNDGDVIVPSSGYALTSTSTYSNININGATIVNTGSGGGINVNNGATSTSNNLSNFSTLTGVGAPSVTAGNAATLLCDALTQNVLGSVVPPTGTNWIPCEDEKLIVFQNEGIGTTSPYAALSVVGSTGVVADHYTATSSTPSLFTGGFLADASSTINGNLTLSGVTGTQCLHAIAGVVSGTGSDCGSGGGGSVGSWFTPQTWGNSTSTTLGFYNGFLSQASSTIASTLFDTNLAGGLMYVGSNSQVQSIASSSLNIGGTALNVTGVVALVNGGTGLNSINGNQVLYTNSSGTAYVTTATSTLFGTGTNGQVLMLSGGIPVWAATSTASGGGTFPFTPNAGGWNSTSTLLALNGGLLINNASTTITGGLQVTGGATTTNLAMTGGAGAGCAQFNADGALTSTGSYCGTTSGSVGNWFVPATDGPLTGNSTTTALIVNVPGVGLDVSPNSGYGIGGFLLGYASSTNGDTIFGLGAGGQNATTSSLTLSNSAFGYHALNAANSGSTQNTAIGANSLALNTTGSYNTAFGYSSLASNLTGSNSFGLGEYALFKATGSSNIALGYAAGGSLTTGQNDIAIGNGSTPPLNTGNNQLNLANLLYGSNIFSSTISTSSTPSPNGLLGIGTTTPFAKLSIHLNSNDANNLAFAIGSTSLATGATTTLFMIDNQGNITTAMTGTQCLHEISGLISGTGSDCGSGGGGSVGNWFTPLVGYNATSTTLGFENGIFTNGASTTLGGITVTVASTTGTTIGCYVPATSTSMYINMASTTCETIYGGTSAINLYVSSFDLAAGQQTEIDYFAPANTTGGGYTWYMQAGASAFISNIGGEGSSTPGACTSAGCEDIIHLDDTGAAFASTSLRINYSLASGYQ